MERNLTNRFDETTSVLARHEHTLYNIEHITLYGTGIGLHEFVEFAKAFDYNCSYGHEWVPPFVLKMDDGTWYERAEYDGSEWWSFNKAPEAPEEYSRILHVLVENDMDWLYKEASNLAESIEDAAYAEMWADIEAEYEAMERMDAYSDEYEGIMDAPVVPSKGDWHDGKGKYAHKSRCTREVWDESCYGIHIRWATKHNSKCWKDQRGKGRRRRDTQYRA